MAEVPGTALLPHIPDEEPTLRLATAEEELRLILCSRHRALPARLPVGLGGATARGGAITIEEERPEDREADIAPREVTAGLPIGRHV